MATAHPPLGIIGSSGGSALAAAAACLQEAGIEQPWVVVTDRPCGLSEWAGRQGHAVRVFAYEGTEENPSDWYWFEGNFEAYEENKVKRLGPDAAKPHRSAYRKLTRD